MRLILPINSCYTSYLRRTSRENDQKQGQFQKNLSIPAFLDSYGEERQCEDVLFAARWPDGLHCPACGTDSFCRLGCRRAVLQCNSCKRQVSLLAGTVFESTKLPLTVWFLAMDLLSQAENGMSALEPGR